MVVTIIASQAPKIIQPLVNAFRGLFGAGASTGLKAGQSFTTTAGKQNWVIPKGTTAISSGRISNAGVKAGVGIGATGAGIGVLGLGTQQLIEPLSQVANPIDSLLGKGTGWLLIVGAVILLIVGLLFKR